MGAILGALIGRHMRHTEEQRQESKRLVMPPILATLDDPTTSPFTPEQTTAALKTAVKLGFYSKDMGQVIDAELKQAHERQALAQQMDQAKRSKEASDAGATAAANAPPVTAPMSMPSPARGLPASAAAFLPSMPAPMPSSPSVSATNTGFGGPSMPFWQPGRTPTEIGRGMGEKAAAFAAPQLRGKSEIGREEGERNWQQLMANPDFAAQYAKADPADQMRMQAEVRYPQISMSGMGGGGGAVGVAGTIAGNDPSIQQFNPDPKKSYHLIRDRSGKILNIFEASFAPMFSQGPTVTSPTGEQARDILNRRTGQTERTIPMGVPVSAWSRTATGQRQQLVQIEDPDNPGQLIEATVTLGTATTTTPNPPGLPGVAPRPTPGLPTPSAPKRVGTAASQVRASWLNELTPGAQSIVLNAQPTLDLIDKARAEIKRQGWDKDTMPGQLLLPRLGYALGFGADIGGFLGSLSLDQVISAGSILRTSGGVRAVQALNLALVHTPDAWKDSGKLMYDKLGSISDRLRTIVQVARDEGKRLPGLPRPETPLPIGKTGPTPGMIEDGYRFKGGDPKVPANWEKVQ